MTDKARFTVVGLGELTWDLLPEGRRLGGAPTNFAYVASLLGDRGAVASRVGADALGREAVERLARAGLSADYVQVDREHPTGTVGVRIGAGGEAHYTVNQNSAWDHLEWTARWEELARRADAVCFGTLGQREPRARASVLRFLEAMRPTAVRVFDVNLRHSFFGAELLRDSLSRCDVLKLSAEELPRLCELLGAGAAGDEPAAARRLLEAHDLRLVALTRGARGSLLVGRGGERVEHAGFRVRVADTIGAGDAFAAALTHKLLRGASLAEASDAANRTGAWLTTQTGATPEVSPAELPRILAGLGAPVER